MDDELIVDTVVGVILVLVAGGTWLLYLGTVRIAGLRRVATRYYLFASLALFLAALVAVYAGVFPLVLWWPLPPPAWAWPLAAGFLWLPAAWLIIKVRFRTTLDRAALASLPVVAMYATLAVILTWMLR